MTLTHHLSPISMEITVACPNCNYKLHLPSREFLGRKGKCPACELKFVLEETQSPEPAKPTAASEPPAKPKPAAKSAPSPGPQAKSKPSGKPADARDQERKTVVPAGKTRANPAAVPAPREAEFQKLKDPDSSADDSEAGDKESATLIEDVRKLSSDSALVPEGLWDDIETPESKPDEASVSLSQKSSAFDLVARCTHCHRGVEFRRDDELRDFPCPHCSKRFSLIHPESSAEAVSMPKQVGMYLLAKYPRIGIGPFGNVYRAKDGQSQESVAIKVARGDQVSEAERQKFLTTLRLVMQLKHSNIATLHEVEAAEGRVYLVSSYINGIDLSEYLAGTPERQLSVREVASTCALVASVLHHGHKFGVIHGNLKPTNIRLDGGLKPYIFDFGLGHRESAVRMTGNGRIVGTAAYLAPEQLPPNRRDPDAQTDVFAMGVIFYELLTGQRPFPGEGPQLLKQIAKGLPRRPRSINSAIPKALETICMKCLEADPRDRYQSAMDVYKELRLYLEDKPIHTKPPGIFTRMTRWFRRRPIMAGMLLTFVSLAVLGAGYVGFRLWQQGGFS